MNMNKNITAASPVPVALSPEHTWVEIDRLEEEDGTFTVTEAMSLPHGCLVRSRLVFRGWFANRVAVSQAFVPNVKLVVSGRTAWFEHRL